MMKKLPLYLFLFFSLAASAQPQQKTEQIIVDGLQREFVTYIPSVTNTADQLPVVISLHGRLGTGEKMMDFADFRPLAEKEKFIIVCPSGINRSWNDGRSTPAQKKGINDVKFIDQLITYVISTYHADKEKIYVTGMSNGGFLASRLACELNNRITAVAVVAASLDKDMNYHPEKSMPIMYIQGTKDPLVPYNGGTTKGADGSFYGHKEAMKLWADAAHISNKPIITRLPDKATDGTTVIKEEYTPKLIGYTITNGGHTWPGGSQYLPKFLVGKVSNNMDACEVIWDFFKGNKK